MSCLRPILAETTSRENPRGSSELPRARGGTHRTGTRNGKRPESASPKDQKWQRQKKRPEIKNKNKNNQKKGEQFIGLGGYRLYVVTARG